MSAVAQKSRLSDGRVVRALGGTFTQEQMFGLHKSGLFNPAVERIMDVKDHDDSLNVSKVWETINVNGWWRTGRYAAYRRGFEKEDLQVGDKIVWVERDIARTLEIPDVPVAIIRPDGKSEIIGLRQAVGLLDFDLTKLQYDLDARVVSVTSDFNPETDVRVVDIMRPRGWALVDANGYPLKSNPSDERAPEARYSYVRLSENLAKKATGWHGSLACYISLIDGKVHIGSRGVAAVGYWYDVSGVAIVEKMPVSKQLSVREESGRLIVEGTPEQITAAARLLEQLKRN